MDEAQTMRSVDKGDRNAQEGKEDIRWQLLRRGDCTVGCRSHISTEVNDHDQHQCGCESPRANTLGAHRVVHAVEYHATDQGEGHADHDDAPERPQCHLWRDNERDPSARGEAESHQEGVARKGAAEELRCESRLVGGVCKGSRDGVHRDAVRQRRAVLRVVLRVVLAPQGVACEESRLSIRGVAVHRKFSLHRLGIGTPH